MDHSRIFKRSRSNEAVRPGAKMDHSRNYQRARSNEAVRSGAKMDLEINFHRSRSNEPKKLLQKWTIAEIISAQGPMKQRELVQNGP